jgi:hypothetical protein
MEILALDCSTASGSLAALRISGRRCDVAESLPAGKIFPMGLTETVIEGTLKADGTLELDEKPDLPAGRVTVVLR